MKFKSSAIIITFIKLIKVPNVIEIERVGEQRKSFLKMIMTTRMLARMIKDARNKKLESYRNSLRTPSSIVFCIQEWRNT